MEGTVNQVTSRPVQFYALGGRIVDMAILLGAAPGLVAEPGSPSSVIGDLKAVSQFSELFNREAGHPRLVLLLSPT